MGLFEGGALFFAGGALALHTLNLFRGGVVVDEDAGSGAVQIVELAGFQRPDKSSEPGKAEKQRDRDEEKQGAHDPAVP